MAKFPKWFESGQEENKNGMQDAASRSWACKCTAINDEGSDSCWKCKLTKLDSERILYGLAAASDVRQEVELKDRQLQAQINKSIESILICSVDIINSIPLGGYKIKGFVSAQTIESTGFLLNVSGIDGPLSGVGIDFANAKNTRAGEERVLNDLKKRAHAIGANAVIGVDIDFSDSGGFKSVLICAQGTAVYIDDIDLYFDKNPRDDTVCLEYFRKCPHCAESIRAEAILCRYCGQDVVPNQEFLERKRAIEEMDKQKALEIAIREKELRQKIEEEAKKPKGVCPSCKGLLNIDAVECHHCSANFGPHAAWKILPMEAKDK